MRQNVQLEAWRRILGILIKTVVYKGMIEYLGGCNGVYVSCFDALFEGVSRVQLSA